MESNELLQALDNYFSTLSVTGYTSYDQVERLIVMSFIQDLLASPFMTDEDSKYISNAVECFYGNCLTPYPEREKALINVDK